MKQNQIQKAFTLVELIVVITILAILGTIAFISLQGYSSQARDSTRISDLSTMKTSLELFNLDAGKYPLPTDGFDVIYSGTTVWSQGIFGENTYKNVEKLDKIPKDPLIDKEYTYSVTKTRQEYQLSGVIEGNEVVNGPHLTYPKGRGIVSLLQTNAGDKEATAIVTGNYNGAVLKTSTGGVNCAILSIPSIISSQPETVTVLEDILTATGLVYHGHKNLGSNFKNSKYKINGGFNFNSKKLVTYSDNKNCSPLYDTDDNSARTTLITNLQIAYSGTIIEGNGKIADIINLESNNIDLFANSLVNNDLGGKLELKSKENTYGGNETNPGLACKDILENGGNVGDGIYWIKPNGINPIKVYCDMNTDGGGWSLVYSNNTNSMLSFMDNRKPNINQPLPLNLESYSIGVSKKIFHSSNPSEILFSCSGESGTTRGLISDTDFINIYWNTIENGVSSIGQNHTLQTNMYGIQLDGIIVDGGIYTTNLSSQAYNALGIYYDGENNTSFSMDNAGFVWGHIRWATGGVHHDYCKTHSITEGKWWIWVR